MPKRERLETRIPPEVKRELQEAADLRGQTLTEFVVTSARNAAEQVLRDHRLMALSECDARAFAEALLGTDAAGPRLRNAAARYNALVESR